MGIKEDVIPVYAIDVFDGDNKAFWIGRLGKILEKYTHLEFAHRQQFYALIYIEEAVGEMFVDNSKIQLDQSKIIFVKPGSITRLNINRNAKGSFIAFTEGCFSLRYNNNVLQHFSILKRGAKEFVRLNEMQAVKLNHLIGLMHNEYELRLKSWEKVIRSYLNIVLYDIDRNFKPFQAPEKFSNKEEKVLLFEKLVDEFYQSVKMPALYAAKLHISTNYLNKLCQDCRGITAGEVIRNRIVIEAQRLLQYTSLTVGEIGHRLGFDNLSYFVTFFKKNSGTTPESFRRSVG